MSIAPTNSERVDTDSLLSIRLERRWLEWNIQVILGERDFDISKMNEHGLSIHGRLTFRIGVLEVDVGGDYLVL